MSTQWREYPFWNQNSPARKSLCWTSSYWPSVDETLHDHGPLTFRESLTLTSSKQGSFRWSMESGQEVTTGVNPQPEDLGMQGYGRLGKACCRKAARDVTDHSEMISIAFQLLQTNQRLIRYSWESRPQTRQVAPCFRLHSPWLNGVVYN